MTMPDRDDADESEVSTREDLEEQVAEARRKKFADVWLMREGGEMFALLKNGDKAWAMYMRHDNDAGFSTRNPAYAEPKDAVIEYRLGNGQRDAYPAAWAVPAEEALRAAEYFFEHGTRAPWLTWHDDSHDDE